MSLVPYFDDICQDLDLWHSKFFNDPFFWDHHFHHSWCCTNFLRTKVSVTDKGFQIKMNLPHFKVKDITVKTLDDVIVIEGKQKRKHTSNGNNNDNDNDDDDDDDDRYCYSRHFIRKYKLPRGYNPYDVTSTFSSDGVLTVKAPAPIYIPDVKERIIDVKQIEPEY